MKKFQIPMTAQRPSGSGMPVCGPRPVASCTTGHAVAPTATRVEAFAGNRAARLRRTEVSTRIPTIVFADAGAKGYVGLVPATAWGTTAWRPPTS